MYVKVVTDLATEPVTLQEAKTWMRINDFTSDDTLITALIKSSRTLLERYTGLSFGTKTLEVIVEIEKNINLPYSPLQTMTSVYRRFNNQWELMTVNTDYYIIGDTLRVTLPGEYKLTYVAGFTVLPEPLKTDIKVIVAWQYENRNIKFSEGDASTITGYPFINLLNSRAYKSIVI